MAIVDVVKFFIQRATQIIELVNAFTQSMAAIASGKVGAVAKAIEDALGKAIPVLIGFLASLLGLGGIADKVLGIIRKIRQRIVKAITSFWLKIKRGAGKLLSKLGIGKKGKEKNENKDENIEVGSINSFSTIKEEFPNLQENKTHKAYYKGKDPLLHIESTPTSITNLFINKNAEAKESNDQKMSSDLIKAKSYYFKTVRPKEKELKKADLQYSEDSKSAISRQKKSKGFDSNTKLRNELDAILTIFTRSYLSKLFKAELEYPDPKLPVMSDNSKARSFVADYINEYVKNGSESHEHLGSLEGWAELSGERLKEPHKWVRMHLLPHQIGGNAVDSNLTPALGEINKDFSKKVELSAINKAKKNPKGNRDVIWYKFKIKYYEGNVFPSFLFASYGTYSWAGNDWKRNNPIKEYHRKPSYPDFEFKPFNMKILDWDPKLFAKTLGVTESFAKKVKENGGYDDIDSLEFTLENKLKMNSTNVQNLNIVLKARQKSLIIF